MGGTDQQVTKKTVHIGLYSDTPEEAVSIYARAAFCLERMKSDLFSDSVLINNACTSK